jgi:hypothetical protein
VQARGIGYALLYDLLDHFGQRSGRTITVTLKRQPISLALYRKAGFQLPAKNTPFFSSSYPHLIAGILAPDKPADRGKIRQAQF